MTIVKQFTIEYLQFLDENGTLNADAPPIAKNAKALSEMYRWMVLVRAFDTKAIVLQRTGKLGTFASVLGQEAIGTAIGYTMLPNDVLCPAYREYCAMVQRGVKMREILQFWGGDERGNAYECGSKDFPISVPIGTQPLHAAGAARAFQIRKQSNVAVSVCGDGATSQGDFYEAMNVVGAWKLPCIFVINNNQWAISVSRKVQTGAETLAQKGIAANLHVEQVDGNDIIAVHYAMENALARARAGEGGSVIEAITYRLGDHTTADDASRYREKAELDAAWKNEPVIRLKNYLLKNNFWTEEKEQQMLAEITQEVEKAVHDYLTIPPEPVTAMFDSLYETLPAAYAEQRETLIKFEVKGHG